MSSTVMRADSSSVSVSRNLASKRDSSSICRAAARIGSRCGSVALVQRVVGGHRRAVNPLGVGQHALLGFELRVLVRLQAGVGDFLALIAPQVEQPQAVVLVALQIGDALPDLRSSRRTRR